MKLIEKKSRSFTKAISWRMIASLTTVLIAYFLTGDVLISASIAGIEVVAKMIIYYFHERMWSNVDWGFEKTNLD
jgi:uncharacterized membrane protein